MPSFPDRVAARASEVRPTRLALSILAAPFYVLGWLLGVLLVAFSWVAAAVTVGISDARTRRDGGSDGVS